MVPYPFETCLGHTPPQWWHTHTLTHTHSHTLTQSESQVVTLRSEKCAGITHYYAACRP